MSEIKPLLKRIFSVHKCVGCRKILDGKDFERAFCPACREGYLASKMAICPECSLSAEECRCMPPLLKKSKVKSLRKLFFYSKEKGSEPQNRLIYYLKRNKSRRVSADLAIELFALLKKELARSEPCAELIIVSVPRSRGALFEHGFDQSVILAGELSKISKIEYSNALKGRGMRKYQKKLTAGERLKNVKGRIFVDKTESERISGRSVILLDDVVTTGASLSACASILLDAGAKEVFAIAISSDIRT